MRGYCFYFLFFLLGALLFCGCQGRQQIRNQADITRIMSEDYRFSAATAHPKAAALMKEDYYWSAGNDFAPFGNDGGSDAAYGFLQWRRQHPGGQVMKYVNELMDRWQYPAFNPEELDEEKIKAYVNKNREPDPVMEKQYLNVLMAASEKDGKRLTEEQAKAIMQQASQGMGGSYLLDMDDAFTGVCFAQFATEGHVDDDVLALTQKVLKRELMPVMLNLCPEEHRQERKKALEDLLVITSKMNI